MRKGEAEKKRERSGEDEIENEERVERGRRNGRGALRWKLLRLRKQKTAIGSWHYWVNVIGFCLNCFICVDVNVLVLQTR